MSAFDLSRLLWPDASLRRQPQHAVKLRDAYAGGVAFIGPDRVDYPETLSSQVANPRRVILGEQAIAAKPSTSTRLGDAGGSHILTVRIKRGIDGIEAGGWTYFLNVGSISLAFTPYHFDYGNRALVYDGTLRDSNFVLSDTSLSTLVIRFLPGETTFFVNGTKTATAGRTVVAGTWEYGNQYLEGKVPDLALLAWVPGAFTDADCIRISDEPYSALFEPIYPVGFDFPAGVVGAPTLTSLTMSAFTSSGARATLGITR